ncbi:WecB/TagA/CpsF family glycosyltransferase [Ferdinandcohnia sp. Marseille-Q9671]
MNIDTVNILGVNFTKSDKNELLQVLTKRIDSDNKTFIVTANPEIVMHAVESEDYFRTLENADYIIPDGIGIIKAAEILKNPLPERIAGFDLMLELLRIANSKKLKVYLLGAEEEVLNKTVENIRDRYSDLDIAGYQNGYFNFENNQISEEIANLKPDLVLVALGVPRQEKWIYENMHKFEKGLFMGVGGSFDVLAGNVKRAPLLWQKMNVEWLYRLIQQPWRWKRMLALPRFVTKVITQKNKQ